MSMCRMKNPTEKQANCVKWICKELNIPMPEPSFDEYRIFISKHIEQAREHDINRRFNRLMRRAVRDARRDILT